MVSRLNFAGIAYFLSGFAIISLIIKLIPSFYAEWWIHAIFVVGVLMGLHYRNRISTALRAGLFGFLIAIIIGFGYLNVQTIYSNVTNLNEFDFITFWINGRVASQGLDFYDPAHYHDTASIFTTSEVYKREILDVGFWYPPPSILIFLPLGWFEPQVASLLWNAFLVLLLIVDIYLLWKFFLRDSGLLGFLATSSLMLLMIGTTVDFVFSQTMFLLLFFLLIVWSRRDQPDAGIWLVLAVLVKPLVVGLGLYLLLRQRWKQLIAAMLTGVALCIVTAVIFGPDTFINFFTGGVTSRIPDFVYTEKTNQSLLAVVLRATNYDFSGTSPVRHPLYLGITIILTSYTLLLVWLLPVKDTRWGMLLFLTLLLIIYPNSNGFYGIVLIIPLLLIWNHREEMPGGVRGTIIFIAIEYALFNFGWGIIGFLSFLLCWGMLAVVCTRILLSAGLLNRQSLWNQRRWGTSRT